MPFPRTFRESKILPFTPGQVYAVVAEVDKYPEFVPWCVGSQRTDSFLTDEDREFIESGVTIGKRDVQYIEMSVGFRALHDSYVSRVLFEKDASVVAESVDSRVFKHLVSTWKFRAAEDGGSKCIVDFDIAFEFKSYLYAYFANIFFAEVATQMVRAFDNRCAVVYGEQD